MANERGPLLDSELALMLTDSDGEVERLREALALAMHFGRDLAERMPMCSQCRGTGEEWYDGRPVPCECIYGEARWRRKPLPLLRQDTEV